MLQHLMPSSPIRMRRTVGGKVVLVTGSSDGIGAHLARRLGAAGARVLLVARTEEKLREVGDAIRAAGGEAHEYVANLAQPEDCDRVLAEVLADHGHVDILVCNAGRSIRRSAKFQGGDRFHDFQRLMALNFFGALRLALGFLPHMMERRSGHIVHVSSFGVPTRQPRFAGYAASKSAFDAALAAVAGEVAAHNIHTTSVFMPLVQTKMLESKGHSYEHVTSTLTLDMACTYIEHALVTKPREMIDGPSRFLALMYFIRPSLIVALNSWVYRLEGELPPDGRPADKPAAAAAPAAKQRGTKRSRLMAVGIWLLWFFSRLEFVLALQLGVPWLVRDLIVVVIFLLVLVVQPICAAVCQVVWAVQGALHFCRRPRQARGCPPIAAAPEPSAEQGMEPAPVAQKGADLIGGGPRPPVRSCTQPAARSPAMWCAGEEDAEAETSTRQVATKRFCSQGDFEGSQGPTRLTAHLLHRSRRGGATPIGADGRPDVPGAVWPEARHLN